LLALVVAEGVLSLSTGRSLRELATGARVVDDPLREWRATDDDDRIAAAARLPGLYKVHEDPLVGYTMRAEASLLIGDGAIVTDKLGMRVRPLDPQGHPDTQGDSALSPAGEADPSAGSDLAPGSSGDPGLDPLRVLVLGDSVAFGHGVDDDETLAHQLELLLRDALPWGSRPVICNTVAAPGWNHRNAVHFLLDHFDHYAPDIVLYLPISNDLTNTYGVYETGHRWDGLDLGSADPWLESSIDERMASGLAAVRRLKAAGRPLQGFRDRLGPLAVNADLSPESSRRYDENARSIALLNEQLTRQGARLMLVQLGQEVYFWHLLRRLPLHGLDLPVVPLFSQMLPEFTLGSDPHNNAEALGVMARWCAEAMAAEGWLEGLESLPARGVPEAYVQARATPKGLAEWQRESDKARTGHGGLLQPELNTDTGQGLFQVYGGLNADGSARRRLLLLLAPGDGLLRVSLAPLPGREDLQPQTVRVSVNGIPLGSLELTSAGPAEARFPWPSTAADGEPIEVLLEAEREVVIAVDGRSTMACYRLLSVSTNAE